MSEISNKNEEKLRMKLNKVLELRLDADKDTLDALRYLETFYHENTLQTRRNFRSLIQSRGVQINQDFLMKFELIKNVVDSLTTDIDEMANEIKAMKKNLQNSKDVTNDLIKHTNILQDETNRLKIHQEFTKAFIKKFQLNLTEHQILYGKEKDSPLTAEFFIVLDRVQTIQSNCRILMQSGCQGIALDIMEEMTLHHEGALERLYRWTQNHCRNLDSNDIGELVIKAMQRLQDRPILFKYVIDEYATARRAVFVRSFIDALTVGGPNGNPKPIEMHAHDAKRYIGDMFAWLHQTIPSEKENLLALIKLCDKNDLSDQIQTSLAHIADGLCHPLKVRVETILNSEKDTIILFAISNLLRFYQNIINQVVKGGNLEQLLFDLQKQSEEVYLNSLTIQVKIILQHPTSQTMGLEPPQRDLIPPPSVGRLLNILKEILSVASMVEGRQADIKKIVTCVIDPLLQTVTESASHLPTVDMAVYILNCLYNMQTTLTMYEYMDERMERLQGQSDAQIDTLTSEQASSLVANLNLGPIYTILQNKQEKIEANLLKIFVDKLNAFLEMPDVLLLPQINLLMSSTHKATVTKRSFDVIVAIYKQIHERINDPENGFENPELILSKTPEQVSEILSS